MNSTKINRFIGEAEAKKITTLSRTTRWRMECNGAFPKRYKISARRSAYKQAEVLEWLENCQQAA